MSGDYMRDIIRNDQKKHVNLDEVLLEGLNSGNAVEASSAFWEKKRQQLKQRFNFNENAKNSLRSLRRVFTIGSLEKKRDT